MQSKIFRLILFIFICTSLFSQERKGLVTYQSSQFVYVKFDNTDGINKNDTLYIKESNTLRPALLSVYISTGSCACKYLKELTLKNGDEVIVRIRKDSLKSIYKSIENRNEIPNIKSAIRSSIKTKSQTKKNNRLDNKLLLSVQSYSTTSNISGLTGRQQWRYLISADFYQFQDIPLTLSTYLTYKHRPGWPDNNVSKSLNVYDLSLRYELSKDFDVVLGRKINEFMSSLSTIDGIQFNKKWGNTRTGLVLGSRPDLNYSSGVNFKLFETGAYVSRTDSILNGTANNTLAVFEQTNSFKTDRRFIYYQHNNDIFQNLHTFISSEIDLFLKEKGKSRNIFNLTDLYILLHYNLNRNMNISASYDNRKNIIYYETFKNGLDSLIDREIRQGARIELNIRPFKQILFSAGGGYNFKKNDIKPTRNLSAGLFITDIPILKINSNFSYTTFENSFITGNVYGINLSKDLLGGNFYSSIGYRNSNYKVNFAGKSFQHFLSFDMSCRLINQLFFTSNYELELERKTSYNRLLFGLSARLK